MNRLPWKKATPAFFFACILAYAVPSLFLSDTRLETGAVIDYSAALASSTPESLAHYAQSHRLDPIFAIEGTDPAKLRNAIGALFEEKDRLLETYGAQGSSIGRTIYPASFLANLPRLEEARQALLDEPTVESAGAYHYLLEETIAYYARDARALAGTLASMDKRTPTLGYLAGKASTADMAAKMGEVASQALRQKQKEEDRFACLRHLSEDCAPPNLLKSARAAQLGAPAILAAPGAGVYKVEALARRILPDQAYFDSASQAILAIPSNCYLEPVAYGLAYRLAPYEGGAARKFNYINDAYFRDLTQQAQARQTPFYAELQKAGVTLSYQNLGNLYNCPDSGFDVAEAGSLTGVLAALSDKESPTAAEQELLALPVVQKADLAPHMQAAAKLGTPEGDALVERYLEGSADFDQIVLGVHSDNRFLEAWNRDQAVVSFEFMLTARNFASTLFLLGNPTFTPEKVSLFSGGAPSKLEDMFLRGYLDDVSKEYADEDILAQHRRLTDIAVDSKLRSR